MKREIQLAKQIQSLTKDAMCYCNTRHPRLVAETLKLVKGASDDLVFLLQPKPTYVIQWRWRGDKKMKWCGFPTPKMSKLEAEKFVEHYRNLPLVFRIRPI